MCENKVLYLKGNCNFYVKYFVVDNIICFYRFMNVCIYLIYIFKKNYGIVFWLYK